MKRCYPFYYEWNVPIVIPMSTTYFTDLLPESVRVFIQRKQQQQWLVEPCDEKVVYGDYDTTYPSGKTWCLLCILLFLRNLSLWWKLSFMSFVKRQRTDHSRQFPFLIIKSLVLLHGYVHVLKLSCSDRPLSTDTVKVVGQVRLTSVFCFTVILLSPVFLCPPFGKC